VIGRLSVTFDLHADIIIVVVVVVTSVWQAVSSTQTVDSMLIIAAA